MFLVGNEKTPPCPVECGTRVYVYVLTIFLSFNVKQDALIYQIIHNSSVIYNERFMQQEMVP